ncbi:MAG: hypothetical protein ABW202_15525 [Duganella sp.]
MLPALAHAQDGGRRDDQRNEQRTAQSAQRQQDIRAEQQRQLEQRSYELRAEEQRRAMRDGRAAEMSGRAAEMSNSSRVGRMTADERRDLRRQINEAGQDVYALPPRR